MMRTCGDHDAGAPLGIPVQDVPFEHDSVVELDGDAVVGAGVEIRPSARLAMPEAVPPHAEEAPRQGGIAVDEREVDVGHHLAREDPLFRTAAVVKGSRQPGGKLLAGVEPSRRHGGRGRKDDV
jgi:hypothetical protein